MTVRQCHGHPIALSSSPTGWTTAPAIRRAKPGPDLHHAAWIAGRDDVGLEAAMFSSFRFMTMSDVSG
jgi:hypothetical protein